ncbi:hypothetical protein V5799_013121 [Amblyomma americanum]|uniref:Secreted protein n=1 Tax=Amblyomma americanum TaxID=6943 RepID=A0AAQ4E6T4_AMBAM
MVLEGTGPQNKLLFPSTFLLSLLLQCYVSTYTVGERVDCRFDCEADHERAYEDVATFRHQLQTWALESGSSHAAVTSLLKVLRSHKCFSSLPSSARALLQTPKKSNDLSEISGGQYRHFGVEAGIRQILGECRDLPPELNLTFHIDALPSSKSSRGTTEDICSSEEQ